jgi:hypothetical protein
LFIYKYVIINAIMAENIEPKPEIKFTPEQSFEQAQEHSESVEQHSVAPPPEVELDDSERPSASPVEQAQSISEATSVQTIESPPISAENERVKEHLMEGIDRSHPETVSNLMEMLNGTLITPEDHKK